jgi:hypothetical protein
MWLKDVAHPTRSPKYLGGASGGVRAESKTVSANNRSKEANVSNLKLRNESLLPPTF